MYYISAVSFYPRSNEIYHFNPI